MKQLGWELDESDLRKGLMIGCEPEGEIQVSRVRQADWGETELHRTNLLG